MRVIPKPHSLNSAGNRRNSRRLETLARPATCLATRRLRPVYAGVAPKSDRGTFAPLHPRVVRLGGTLTRLRLRKPTQTPLMEFSRPLRATMVQRCFSPEAPESSCTPDFSGVRGISPLASDGRWFPSHQPFHLRSSAPIPAAPELHRSAIPRRGDDSSSLGGFLSAPPGPHVSANQHVQGSGTALSPSFMTNRVVRL